MRRKQGRRFLSCVLGLLATVLLWRPMAGLAGDSPASTNLAVVARKAPSDTPLPGRPRNAAPQAKLYFGSRIESVTAAVAPQNPFDSNYTSALHSYHKAIIGFRIALTAHAYVFVGVGMAVSDNLLEQGFGPNGGITAAQIQNALAMQTEYGLGWDF